MKKASGDCAGNLTNGIFPFPGKAETVRAHKERQINE